MAAQETLGTWDVLSGYLSRCTQRKGCTKRGLGCSGGKLPRESPVRFRVTGSMVHGSENFLSCGCGPWKRGKKRPAGRKRWTCRGLGILQNRECPRRWRPGQPSPSSGPCGGNLAVPASRWPCCLLSKGLQTSNYPWIRTAWEEKDGGRASIPIHFDTILLQMYSVVIVRHTRCGYLGALPRQHYRYGEFGVCSTAAWCLVLPKKLRAHSCQPNSRRYDWFHWNSPRRTSYASILSLPSSNNQSRHRYPAKTDLRTPTHYKPSQNSQDPLQHKLCTPGWQQYADQ